ncbi:MAG TPA: hypothetical protein VK324_09355, partial [Tepidisphaeraceae bacterium]|nr:hypothetical protein [Tepidisphaeraceae bacterium]
QMTDAMIEFTSSYIALRKAAAGQFGEAATADVMGPPSADASLADSAKEVPAGPDRVRLEMENGPPVTLRKTDGQWQVVPEPPPGGDPEAQLTVATRQTKAQSDVFSALAAEVAAGRYKSMNEVKSILQNRMMAAAMTQAAAENQSPATAPATRPALAPEDMMP